MSEIIELVLYIYLVLILPTPNMSTRTPGDTLTPDLIPLVCHVVQGFFFFCFSNTRFINLIRFILFLKYVAMNNPPYMYNK